MSLNAVSYGILGIINAHPSSGYDIMNVLKPFREVKHSQIYRTLAKLEEENYVVSEVVEQSDKPNKKVYSITDKGKNKISDWFFQPSAPVAIRDEFVFKAFLIGLQDKREAMKIFEDRIKQLEESTIILKERLEILKEDCQDVLTDFRTLEFGRYILLQQYLHQVYGNIRWAKWVIDLLEKEDVNYLNYPF